MSTTSHHVPMKDNKELCDIQHVNTVDSSIPIEFDDAKKDTFQPPELVRTMTPDERKRAEKALVRKIDLRLLPMIVLMYIMNYLDRNNIAAAKLAGLQAELNLSSIQYSVSALLYIEVERRKLTFLR
jgi:hypothetical protein